MTACFNIINLDRGIVRYYKRRKKRAGKLVIIILSIIVVSTVGYFFTIGVLEFNFNKLQSELPIINNIKSQPLSSPGKIHFIQNRIAIGTDLYATLTPSGLILNEYGRYNQIKFTVLLQVHNMPYDDSVIVEYQTFLVDSYGKNYFHDLKCLPPLYLGNLLIDGKKTDKKQWIECFDVGKDIKHFDIYYKGKDSIRAPSNTVKIGSIDLNI